MKYNTNKYKIIYLQSNNRSAGQQSMRESKMRKVISEVCITMETLPLLYGCCCSMHGQRKWASIMTLHLPSHLFKPLFPYEHCWQGNGQLGNSSCEKIQNNGFCKLNVNQQQDVVTKKQIQIQTASFQITGSNCSAFALVRL